jgi:hypothetical protein
MERRLLGPGGPAAVSTACRQQGLHHVFAQSCEARDCAACVAGGGFQGRLNLTSVGSAERETLW